LTGGPFQFIIGTMNNSTALDWLCNRIGFERGEALRDVALAILVAAIGLAIAFLPLSLAGMAVLGGILLLVTLIRPEYGSYALILAVPFGSVRELTVGGFTVGATEALAGLVLAGWFARVAAARRIETIYPPLLPPLLIFLGAILLTLTGTLSLRYSLKEILKWLEALAIYLFVVNAINRDKAKTIILFVLLAGIGEALLGFYQFFGRVGPEHFALSSRFIRAYGTFRQPNPYGGYLGLVLPLAYGLLFAKEWALSCADRGVRERPTPRTRVLPISALGFVLMSVALIMSWSRGAWLGFAVAFVVMNAAYSRRSAALFALACFLVASLLLLGNFRLLPEALVHRLTDFLPYLSIFDVRGVEVTDANYALVERMAHWQAAWGMFSDHPWLGVGIGNYEPVYPAYALPGWEEPLGHAHNYYLNIAAEAGLAGLSAYLLLLGTAFREAWRTVRASEGYWRGMAVGILGALTHLSVHNLFDNLYVHSMQVHVIILLGLLYVIKHNGEDASEAVLENAYRH